MSPAVYSQAGGLKIIDNLNESLSKAQAGLEELKQEYSRRSDQIKNTADKVKHRVKKVKGAASGAKNCVDTHVESALGDLEQKQKISHAHSKKPHINIMLKRILVSHTQCPKIF